ncbi:MAG: PQQ-binding-like beta-propeller repeat protein [Chloroflexi bacterium]|nr:PQQ-binding-like beta-propeller repeat protein [Chloroflexota bacterium]
MNVKYKILLVILAIFLLSMPIISGCTGGLSCAAAISRGWAGGAVSGDTLFVVSMTGKVIAIDANSGKVREPIVQLVTQASGGLSCLPSSCGGQTTSSLVLYASPVVQGEIVYVGGTDGKIYAYSFVDNKLLEDPEWIYPRQGTMSGSIIGGITVDNDTVYFATSDGIIYALNADGLYFEWSHKIDSKIWSAPVVDGNTLYIGCFNKTVYALNTADGTEKWEYKTDGSISSTPVVYDNKVFIGDYDRHFYALDATTGNLVWKFPSGNEVNDNPQNWFWAKPVVLNGIIYAPCLDGKIYALDASTGNLVHAPYVLGDSISSSPVVIGDSIIVATSVASTDVKKQRGKVYIINTTNGSQQELGLPPLEDINAPLFAQGNIVYIHTTKDNLYWIDTAAKDIELKVLLNLSTGE